MFLTATYQIQASLGNLNAIGNAGSKATQHRHQEVHSYFLFSRPGEMVCVLWCSELKRIQMKVN